MNFSKTKDSIAFAGIITALFFIAYLSSRYFRIAPTIMSFLMPAGIFFVNKKYSAVFGIGLCGLIMISGFFIEGLSILLLLMIPEIICAYTDKKILKHILLTIAGLAGGGVMYYFFSSILPPYILQNRIYSILLGIFYISGLQIYEYVLRRLTKEVFQLIERK